MTMTDPQPLKLLFICRHNAVRSQVAEVLANNISHGKVRAYSAGADVQPVPDYIQQWAAQFDTQNEPLSSTPMQQFENEQFNMVITLCDKSHQALPEISSDHDHIRWDFHHPDDAESLKHLEIELAERLRLMFLAKGIIR